MLRWFYRLLDPLRHRARLRHSAPHIAMARHGEDLAHRYGEKVLGWKVISRNYRHPMRKLEIDMIAIEGETLVVVEVKTRAPSGVNTPLRAVDDDKIRHISTGARPWVTKALSKALNVRFDVITVILGDPTTIEHHADVYQITTRL